MSIKYNIIHSILAINPEAEVLVKDNDVKKQSYKLTMKLKNIKETEHLNIHP